MSFRQESERIASDLGKQGYSIKSLYTKQDASEAAFANAQLKQDLDSGNLLVHFHRSRRRVHLARRGPPADLFTLDDVSNLNNVGRYPMVLAMTCFSAPLDNPTEDSIGERFLRVAGRGAVAVFAASWTNSPNPEYSNRLITELLKPDHTIGDAIVAAKATMLDETFVQMYNLLGDPALVLARPRGKLQLARGTDRWNDSVIVRVPESGFGGDVDVDWVDAAGAMLQTRHYEARDPQFTLAVPVPQAAQVRVHTSNPRSGFDALGTLTLIEPPPPKAVATPKPIPETRAKNSCERRSGISASQTAAGGRFRKPRLAGSHRAHRLRSRGYAIDQTTRLAGTGFRGATDSGASHRHRTVSAIAPPPAPTTRYAFVFVCQAGEIETKALLLAASLKRVLRGQHELIAAVPTPAEIWGELSPDTRAQLHEFGVRMVPIENPIDPDYRIGNKLACIDVPTSADKIVFLDSDILCLRDFGDPDCLRVPFAAKPADLRTFAAAAETWAPLYAAVNVELPTLRLPTTVSGEFGLAYFNSGVIFVDNELKFGQAWIDCANAIRGTPTMREQDHWLDQVSLPLALHRLHLAYTALDERYNFPAHLKPLTEEPPFFCHYHWPRIVQREPLLLDRVRDLARAHPAIARVMARDPEWAPLLDPATQAPLPAVSAARHDESSTASDLLISGIPGGRRCGCVRSAQIGQCCRGQTPMQPLTPR